MTRFEPPLRLGAAGHRQGGVTLIEALITLLVVSIGLLGIAALQVIGVQEGASAFHHSQATWLAYDMADRMRANPNPASRDPDDPSAGMADIADHYVGIDVSAASMPAPPVTCGAGASCTMTQMAQFDALEWAQLIVGLPNGRGTVTEDAAVGGRYLIQVMWDEIRAGPTAEQEGCPSDPTVTQACVELWVHP